MKFTTEPEMRRTGMRQRWFAGVNACCFITGIVALGLRRLHSARRKTLPGIGETIPGDPDPAGKRYATNHRSNLPVKTGDVLGRLDIPRLGISVAVLQGTSSRMLRLGAGHIEGTPLPGEPGNSGIAGHRDTFFRELKDIRDE